MGYIIIHHHKSSQHCVKRNWLQVLKDRSSFREQLAACAKLVLAIRRQESSIRSEHPCWRGNPSLFLPVFLAHREPALHGNPKKEWAMGVFDPIFPDTCYHLTHYWYAAADIPVASDNPAHYADAIRYNARTPLQGSLLPLTRLVWA